MKRSYTLIGLVLLVIGIIGLLYPVTGLPMPASSVARTSQGDLGISVSSNIRSYSLPLSTLRAGETYKWQTTISNTGTLDWSWASLTMRLGVDGASTTELGASQCGTDTGTCLVEKCSAGTDVLQCREGICTDWSLEYLSSETGWTQPTCGDNMATIELGNIPAGQSKTITFRLTAPSGATGDYPLILNAVAEAGGSSVVATGTDSLSVGTVSGDLVLSLVSMLSIIAGLGVVSRGAGFI